jgi:hypothetical protein
MSVPAWGWEEGVAPDTVLASMGLTAAQTAVLVFNEEVIIIPNTTLRYHTYERLLRYILC